MARQKRKRLNRKFLAILLAVLLGVPILGLVFGRLYYGATFWERLVDKVFPEDPAVYVAQADELRAAGQIDQAEQAYARALRNSTNSEHFYKMATLQLDWSQDQNLTRDERRQKQLRALGYLQAALRIAPDNLDARKLLADMYWGSRQWTRYLEESDKLLAADPDDHLTYSRRGAAYAQLARANPTRYSDDALENFRNAIDRKPDEPSYWQQLAEFLSHLDRPAEAEETFLKAIETNGDNPALRVAYARFLLGRGRRDAAEQQITEAVRRAPHDPQGLRALAQLHIIDRNYELAAKELRQALSIDPADYRTALLLAEIQSRQRQRTEAVQTLRDALAAVADDDTRAGAVLAATTALNYGLANALLDCIEAGDLPGDTLQEVRRLHAALAESGGNEGLKDKIGGRIALLEGDLPGATSQLESALAVLGTHDRQIAALLAEMYIRQRLPGKADQLLDTLLADPLYRDDPMVLLGKARLLTQFNDYDRAAQFAQRAAKADPNQPEAQHLLELLDVLRGRAIALPAGRQPTNEERRLLRNQALMLWSDGRRDEAIDLLTELQKSVGSDPAILDLLLLFLLEQSRADEARAILTDAIRKEPENDRLKFLLTVLDEPDRSRRFQMHMDRAEKITDPFDRAVQKALVCDAFGNTVQYVHCLKEALALRPGSVWVIDRLFHRALLAKDWPLADEAIRATDTAGIPLAAQMYRAELAVARDRFADAIDILQRLCTQQPANKKARTLLGACYLQTGRLDAAEQAFQAVLATDRNYAQAILGMVELTERTANWPQHAQWIQRAWNDPRLRANPYIRQRYMLLSEQRADLQDIRSRIIPQRERMLRENPNDLANRLQLAGLYERTDQLDKAESMLRSVYDAAPKSVEAARPLASFLARRGRSEDLTALLDRLIGQADDPLGALLLAARLTASSNPEAAEALYRRGVEQFSSDPRGHQAYAAFLAQREQWPAAAAQLAQAVRLRGDSTALRKLLILYQIQAGLYDQAAAQIDDSLAQDAEDAEALSLKGLLAMRQGAWDQARASLDRAIALAGDYPVPLLYRAEWFLHTGDVAAAHADIDRARRLAKDPNTLLQVAALYEALGHGEAARDVYRDLLQQNPDRLDAMNNLLRLCFRLEWWPLLERLLADARRTHPQDPAYVLAEAEMWLRRGNHAKRARALGDVLQLTGASPVVLSEYLDALFDAAEYDQVLRTVQQYRDQPAYRTWVEAWRAAVLARRGETDSADQIFRDALTAADDPAQLDRIIRQVARGYGPRKAAERLAEWIAALRPRDGNAWALVGEMQRSAGLFTEAAKSFTQARDLAANPAQRARIEFLLATTAEAAGQYRQAAEHYLAGLKDAPGDVAGCNNLAYLYAEHLGAAEKALPYARRALEAQPDNSNVLDTYGWVLAKLGRFQEAVAVLERAERLSAESALLCYHLGSVYEKLRRLCIRYSAKRCSASHRRKLPRNRV